MNKGKIINPYGLYLLGGILIGILLMGVLVVSFATPYGMHGGYLSTSFSAPANARSGIDAHFIEEMIPHHEDAIGMAQLAKEKSTRPEVLELADSIITSQGKEIEQMKSWYREWYGKDVPEHEEEVGMMRRGRGMHGGMMGRGGDLSDLSGANDFDRAFLREMIPHHQMAVMMASMLKNGTERPEMKDLAEAIITTQSQEIEQMRQWLEEWK